MSGQSVRPDRTCQGNSLHKEHINPLSNRMKSQMKEKGYYGYWLYNVKKKNMQKVHVSLWSHCLQIVHMANSKIGILRIWKVPPQQTG